MRRALLVAVVALCALAGLPAPAGASPDPFIITPESGSPGAVPPGGDLEAPCGIAVDSTGDFFVSDYGHDAVDAFDASSVEFLRQLPGVAAANGPCAVAMDSAGHFYVNELHGAVLRYLSFFGGAPTTLDPGPATGVAVGGGGAEVFVDDRSHVAVYDVNGAPVQVGGQPLVIGAGSLGAGYGVAVSEFPATDGFVYVPDAATETVKVYDPATDASRPVGEIDAGFVSLRDSAIAVDAATGEIYVADDVRPAASEDPEAAIYVFAADGSYQGRLKYNVVDARPPGLAVDNSGGAAQGRVYVTSGQSEKSSVMLYQPGSAGSEALPALPGPTPAPPAQGAEAPLPEPPPPLTCDGDSCQKLPAEPTDPTLTTLLEGAADPPVRYYNVNRLPHYAHLHGHHHRRGHRKGRRGRVDRARKDLDYAGPGSAAIVRHGSLQLKLRGGIAPTRLPREGAAPVSVSVAGEISTTDDSLPPALRTIEIDVNRHGRLETAGLPLCRVAQIHPASTARALAACRRSLVGTGSFSVDAVLSNQEPYATGGRLLLFNGTYDHRHALLGQIYSAHPFASSFVIPFFIDRRRQGRYGIVLSAKLPEALISWGRVTGLEMKLERHYTYSGSGRSFLSAGCPAPEGFGGAVFPLARASFGFAGGRRLDETLPGHCKVRR